MKTLYVSDLDGTLLGSDAVMSEYTGRTLNELVEKEMLFSYATARSYVTSRKVTKGLNAKIPLILYNGAFVLDSATEEILLSNFFGEDVKEVLYALIERRIYPIVYSYKNSIEKFSFVEGKCSPGVQKFLDSRTGDRRRNPVKEVSELYEGELFYITCIEEEEKLKPFYEKYKNLYHCVFQRDIYTQEQWLEIMPLKASKANAVLQLKEYLQCDKLVVFGDGRNDIDMFEIADESYAVENAVEELKQAATEIISSNTEDGVARWLEKHYKKDS